MGVSNYCNTATGRAAAAVMQDSVPVSVLLQEKLRLFSALKVLPGAMPQISQADSSGNGQIDLGEAIKALSGVRKDEAVYVSNFLLFTSEGDERCRRYMVMESLNDKNNSSATGHYSPAGTDKFCFISGSESFDFCPTANSSYACLQLYKFEFHADGYQIYIL